MAYPDKQISRVVLTLDDGARLESEPHTMLGAQGPIPLDMAPGKLRRFGESVVSLTRLERIEAKLLELVQHDRPAWTVVLFRTPENH